MASMADAKRQAGTELLATGNKDTKTISVDGMIGISSKFAVLNRLITRDLNNNTTATTF